MVDEGMFAAPAHEATILRVVGRGTMHHSPTLRAAAEIALTRGTLVCDMSHCDYLDSTLLGCLVGVRKMAEQYGRRFKIVADRSTQIQLFSTSALDKYFDFIDTPPPTTADWLAIEPEDLDIEALSRHVLVCHEQLADRGGDEAETFRRVCNRLSVELEAHSDRAKGQP